MEAKAGADTSVRVQQHTGGVVTLLANRVFELYARM